ncbi:MAG TPA: alpha/beta fold hydrolase [Rhodothermales bacterium]|nr:alpha/beta fold hydrolase [Rhodothermales bacterium]
MFDRAGKIAGAVGQRLLGLEPFPQPEVVRMRYPVVLMHGFGLLAALRRYGHLHEEAMNLRLHGVLAYAPNVAPYSTVPERSRMWKERIERVLEETGAEKVNLIAHSMGGLDARYLISRMGLHERVTALVTVSSPHRGSHIATFVQERPELVRTWLGEFCNWMGAVSLDGCTSDFLAAVEELTPAYVCDTFNPAVPDSPDVRYFSYAGVAGRGAEASMNPALRFLNAILYKSEGVNDGFVSETSARWGQYLGTIPADHARQVGLQFFPAGEFDADDFYVSVARMLAAEGF